MVTSQGEDQLTQGQTEHHKIISRQTQSRLMTSQGKVRKEKGKGYIPGAKTLPMCVGVRLACE